MFESIYKCPKKLSVIKKCWLHDSIADYLTELAHQMYAKATLLNEAHILLRFAEFAQNCGCNNIKDLTKHTNLFVECFKKPQYKQYVRSIIKKYLNHITTKGIIATPEPKVPAPRFFKYISAYTIFLKEQRGISEDSIATIKSYCLKFMLYLYDAGCNKMSKLNRNYIQQFIVSEGNRYSRHTMSSYCSKLRGFLAYLYRSRMIKADFSAVVITPKIYKHEKCPTFLKEHEIRAMLSAVDQNSIIGKRDYAILILLSTYGLRGIEITRLRLEDIDWRSKKIHFRGRKAGNNSTYPLTRTVAESIISYLKNSRHESRYREVFISYKAPYKPVQTVAIRHVVQKYLEIAGIDTHLRGAHILRYSCAQRLFENDFSAKVIGDYLGHRNPETTQRYIKIDIKHLRQVALNDGEEIL